MTEEERIRRYFESAHWRRSAGRGHLLKERDQAFRDVIALVAKPIDSLSLCDVGCGAGRDLMAWRDRGIPEERLAGTELVRARAEKARRSLPAADIRIVDGFDLPFESQTFDVCSASLVLSAIIDARSRVRLIEEMRRITAPGGIVAVYDFVVRKPWNRQVRAIRGRHLQAILGKPDIVIETAPFLPVLDVVAHLPEQLARPVIQVLPRTHRLWVWRVAESPEVAAAP